MFIVVAEEGNIGRAAARLFITQPALSRQMRRLEEELGAQLLIRVPRGVELTGSGRELLDKARVALAAAEDALTIGRGSEPRGRLALGVTMASHQEWFGLAEAFHERYGAVDMEVHSALSDVLQRRVAGGELDAAIVLEPNRLPALTYHHMRDEPLSVWAHPGHRLADRGELSLRDLEGVRVLLVGGAAGRTSGFNRRVRRLFDAAGMRPQFQEAPDLVPMNALRTPDALSVSVATGFPDAVARLTLVPAASMSYEVVHRTDAGTAAVRAFAAFAARHARGA
ncbi:LysR family transcriptional regulator [Baekduia soli]|uniref:LysR family transcriptional regulator n=1 Tax=Baekduia soli TaxID=496014 RepID=UPI001651E68C|nr:LysR substrate-binding domain-containing protein [Baekduia soli]